MTRPDKTEFPLSALNSHLSHVLFASVYQKCEIGIESVGPVPIPVEASSEANVNVKNKTYVPKDCLQIGYGNISYKTIC